jgi:hypothetical protein
MLRYLPILFIIRREFLIKFLRNLLSAVNVYKGGESATFIGILILTIGALFLALLIFSNVPVLVVKLD